MAFKLGGKKPQMNNASSMKTSAAMYASKTSMYGKPMMNGGEDEKGKQSAKTASPVRETVFPKLEPGFGASKLTADLISGRVSPSEFNDADRKFIEKHKSSPQTIYAKITGTQKGYTDVKY